MAYHSNGGYSGDERESRSGDDRPDSDLSDKPIYLLEHLATFTVNKETGIVYPADGMRRLLQLEKTTGIWSQKMQLCLDNQWVLIMDYETGNIIERFPASLIQEPTAFTSNNPMEMYNNILVFIVSGDSGSRSEMHIFQSQSISAVHLVEDLKQLRNGKIITQHRETTIPPPPLKTTASAQHQSMQHHQHQQRETYDGNMIRGNSRSADIEINRAIDGFNNHETDSEIGVGGVNDETSSTSSDKYERDVTVLNHCFDDIEKFIARLQHAAAATRELERRRRNRKSKKKDPGEGLLTLRTRPPHEKEFIDIFAKFKLSFNLLAKLKAHIHDPNAPELVHFLFTPLALIVEASSDTYYESHLPGHVLNPLLTREAINLLINCVTSKETELWRSLGDPWIIPRDQWKGHTGSYHPVFFDGWSPDYPVFDELEHPTTPTNLNNNNNNNNNKRHVIDTHHNFGRNVGGGVGVGVGNDIIDRGVQTTPNTGDYDYDGPDTTDDKYHHQQQQSQSQQHHHHHHQRHHDNSGGGGGGVGGDNVGERTGFRDFSARSDISIDSIERNGLSGNISNPITPNGGSGNNSAAIQSLVGGIKSMGGLNSSQNAGGVTRDEQDIEIWLDKLQSRNAKIVRVTYPRTANNDKELTVVRGEFLEILDDSRKWWKARNSRDQTGHVPHTIVTPYKYPENNDIFNNPLYTQQQNHNKGRPNEPDSPIGNQQQQQQQQNSAEWVRNKHIGRENNFNDIKNVNDKDVQLKNKNEYIPPPPPPLPPAISTTSLTNSRTNLTNRSTSNTSTLKSIKQNSNSNGNTIVPTTIPMVHDQSKDSISSNATNETNGDDMQEELKKVLTMFREKRRNLEINKTPEIYIQQTSQPREIEKWIKAKGFSENVRKKLHGLNGNELFALKRENLQNLCGQEEGKRLASQITIQRNVSGYKTARSSELHAILARAREKSEQLY